MQAFFHLRNSVGGRLSWGQSWSVFVEGCLMLPHYKFQQQEEENQSLPHQFVFVQYEMKCQHHMPPLLYPIWNHPAFKNLPRVGRQLGRKLQYSMFYHCPLILRYWVHDWLCNNEPQVNEGKAYVTQLWCCEWGGGGNLAVLLLFPWMCQWAELPAPG